MPLVTGVAEYFYGFAYPPTLNAYCVNDTSKSDYGKCYNITRNKAVFVQTDTTTWPIDPTTGDSFPCAKDGTCIRYTNTTGVRILSTVYSYTNKQAILQLFWIRVHTPSAGFYSNIMILIVPMIRLDPNIGSYWFLPSPFYEQASWPIYDPVTNFKAYLNPYTITYGNVAIIRWSGNVFNNILNLQAVEGYSNNIWYAFDAKIIWAYESSPLAIIPLDYGRDYVPYQELRSAFGYAVTGVDQPGWNADDIISVLRELFSDRAWAVFDDRQNMLYLYNLTPDYVPDWLIEKLTPTAMKVLQPPADVAVAKAWLDLLNERNAQIPPQAELP